MLMVRVVLVAGRAGVVARLVALQAAQAFFHTPTVLGQSGWDRGLKFPGISDDQRQRAGSACAAHRPDEFRVLQEMLHLWHLRAIAYSRPGYTDRLETARNGNPADFAPAAQVIRGWPDR
jgi:hypothetical protein